MVSTLELIFLVTAFTCSGLAMLSSVLMLIRLHRRKTQTNHSSRLKMVSPREIPSGAILYYDKLTGRKCKRCATGSITVRQRYKICSTKDKGKVALYRLAKVHRCTDCCFKNSSLELDSLQKIV